MVNYGTRAYRPRSLNFLIVFRSPFRINSSEFVRRDCEGSVTTMFMKLNFVCAFIAALACSAFLISSANAGGHHQGVGLSSSATTSTSTSATLPNGRSPLGEPVFLIPSTTTSSSTSTSSGGGGRERIQHMSPARERVQIPEKPTIMGGSDRSTKIIFTPPPTIVGVSPSVTGTGNIAGNNLADRTFGPSILSTGLGLGSKTSNPSPDTQQLSVAQGGFIRSGVPIGTGPQGPPTLTPWIRITPLQYAGPTVEVPTASSV